MCYGCDPAEYAEAKEINMPSNYPQSTGPNDPDAPWNQESDPLLCSICGDEIYYDDEVYYDEDDEPRCSVCVERED